MMPRESKPSEALALQLDRVYGGRKHWEIVYEEDPQRSLFDDETRYLRKPGSDQIADCYRRRFESVFDRVSPASRTFRNSKNSPMFELFFGAGNARGASIAVRIAKNILEST